MNIALVLTISAILLAQIVNSAIVERATSNDEWHYKFSYTKTINSQLTIDCGNNDQIWIGWSHYGTRSLNSTSASSSHKYKPNSEFIGASHIHINNL